MLEQPQEGDYVIVDRQRGGYLLGVQGERCIGAFETFDAIKQEIEARKKCERYYPDCWYISDHGNPILIDLSEDM